ncbi:C40 family peptidase [Actinomadura rubrisoli]|uniref:Peptidoglycan endopeptidase n=1 Tax=Actinomadura rubrisoli TaxID=2530368 RepID=A0A4V2YSA6_9ACTN|nr:C40 family peptidase [Actinomadura rubrisoli]TDD69417.1 peptidoglycan endopeptidase [Actinomadura rubrisoli]
MLQRLRARPGRGDDGLASTVLILGMALVLLAGVLVFSRVAQAGDMRTRAQSAADAAALGALQPLRLKLVEMALAGTPPTGSGAWLVADEAPQGGAEDYARRNEARVAGKVHLSGLDGTYAKVRVTTSDCQLKKDNELTEQERDDLRHGRGLCTDRTGEKGIGRTGNATAVARLTVPGCAYESAPLPPGGSLPEQQPAPPARLVCDGVTAWPNGNAAALKKKFTLRLVDKESAVPYNGFPFGQPGPGGPLPDPGPLPAGTPETVRRAIAFAKAQIGTWYQWGGTCTSPSRATATMGNCDCSSLVQMAYRAGGISIPRVTYDQWRFGQPIPAGQEKPGDLVFFRPGPRGPEHVGIVVDPSTHQMIEAPRTGATVTPASYTRSSLMGFRRPYAG